MKAEGPKDYDEQDERTYPAQSAEQEAADRLADSESAWVHLVKQETTHADN